MTTETVCVPHDDLLELLEDGVDDYWITSESCVRIVGTSRALLDQSVASEPVAWQWLDTAHFRRKIPKHANACHWDPLYRHPPAPVIPEGYALVPIDPTPEMIMAGIDNNSTSWNEDTDQGFPAQVANDVYRAMLSAALQPTEGPTDD